MGMTKGTCKYCNKECFAFSDSHADCRYAHSMEQRQRDRERRKGHYAVRQSLIKEHGGVCSNCGTAGKVQAHHIKPLADGGDNSKENTALLCEVCHLEIHHPRQK